MRIAGVRVGPPSVRLLAEMLEDGGYGETAMKLNEAIRLQVVEPLLTLADYDAILIALGDNCPTALARLRRELLEYDRRRRLAGP